MECYLFQLFLPILYINSLRLLVCLSMTVTFMTVTPGQNGIYKA
jgi:hypothetical protein